MTWYSLNIYAYILTLSDIYTYIYYIYEFYTGILYNTFIKIAQDINIIELL